MKKLQTLCLLSFALGAMISQGAISNTPLSADGGLGIGGRNPYQVVGLFNALQVNSSQFTVDQIMFISMSDQSSTLLTGRSDVDYNAFGGCEIGYTDSRLPSFSGAPGYPSSDKDFNGCGDSLTAFPVPKPATIVAGALLLLPFGASTLRFLRRRTGLP